MHRDLQKDVTQLLFQPGVVRTVNCLERFVGLLEQVRSQRFMRLLAVPWAAARTAKAVHDVEEGSQTGLVWLVRHVADPTAAGLADTAGDCPAIASRSRTSCSRQ